MERTYITEANIDYSRTGIKKIILQVYCQGNKKSSHGPRIKVSNVYNKYRNDDCFVLNILTLKIEEGNVKIKGSELMLVIKWIRLNRKILLDYWKVGSKLSTKDFLNSLQKVRN